jgi:hypothetical protein
MYIFTVCMYVCMYEELLHPINVCLSTSYQGYVCSIYICHNEKKDLNLIPIRRPNLSLTIE